MISVVSKQLESCESFIRVFPLNCSVQFSLGAVPEQLLTRNYEISFDATVISAVSVRIQGGLNYVKV